MPVDRVASVIAAILQDESLHGSTYHIAPAEPTTAAEIEKALATYFDYYGVAFVGPGGLDLGDCTDVERRFYDFVHTYQSYWLADPVFDLTNLQLVNAPVCDCRVDVDCLLRLFEYAVSSNFGRQRQLRAVGLTGS